MFRFREERLLLLVRRVPFRLRAPQLPLKFLDLQRQKAVELAQLCVLLLQDINRGKWVGLHRLRHAGNRAVDQPTGKSLNRYPDSYYAC
jgi:hypothetical protein